MPSPTKKATPAAKARRGPRQAAPTRAGAASNMREEVVAYRKDLIIRVASDAFFEHGYHDCTVDMIAERLSGSKAIVYYYFPDKPSILEEIFTRALAEAQELIRTAIDQGNDPREKLAIFARLYAQWVINNQRVVGVLWREERSLSPHARENVAAGRRAMDDLVALIVREGVSKKQFRVEDIRTTARTISGMISFTYAWWRDDRRLNRDDMAELYAEFALRIVGAAQTPASAAL
jgi:AcrR family transcriptional regulator